MNEQHLAWLLTSRDAEAAKKRADLPLPEYVQLLKLHRQRQANGRTVHDGRGGRRMSGLEPGHYVVTEAGLWRVGLDMRLYYERPLAPATTAGDDVSDRTQTEGRADEGAQYSRQILEIEIGG